MDTIGRTALVSAPRGAVWRYLADLTNLPAWHPPSISMHPLTGRGGRSSTYRGCRRWGQETAIVLYTVDEFVDERHIRVSGCSDGFISDLTIDVDGPPGSLNVSVVEDVIAAVSPPFDDRPLVLDNGMLASRLSELLVAL